MNIASFFMSVLIAYGTLVSFVVHPQAPEDTGEFTPVLRFLITSDSHITTIGDVQTTRLEKMIKMGNKIAAKDKEYNKLDAVPLQLMPRVTEHLSAKPWHSITDTKCPKVLP